MRLSGVLPRYISIRDIEPATIQQYSIIAKQFDAFAGPLGDDVVEKANAWLAHLLETGIARATIKSKRGGLGVLLRYAAKLGDCPMIDRLKWIKVPEQNPDAFTREEMLRLMDAIDGMRGHYKNGIRRRDWWMAYIPAKYDSGLRVSDMFQLEWTALLPDGSLVLTQKKTGWRHKVEFATDTLKAMNKIRHYGGRLIFPWCSHREAYYRAFRRLRQRAGLPKGSGKWIRRSGATHVAMEHGSDAAMKYLGHRTPGLAQRNYIDARQTIEKVFRPSSVRPELEKPAEPQPANDQPDTAQIAAIVAAVLGALKQGS